jgi:hypothetical protein
MSIICKLLLSVYIRLKDQCDALGFVCILYFTVFVLHVLGDNYTHHQEPNITITHTYGCTLQFVLLMMGVIITRNI